MVLSTSQSKGLPILTPLGTGNYTFRGSNFVCHRIFNVCACIYWAVSNCVKFLDFVSLFIPFFFLLSC